MRRIDLNLLRVFEAVLEHRSVRGASEELGLTPSAVSHALARLRQTLGDDLFVPGIDRMEPTMRALELAPAFREGLLRIHGAIDGPTFEPAHSFRQFRVAASDYLAAMVLPIILARLALIAPHVGLRVFPLSRMDLVRNLDEGRVDFVVGWFGDLPERMRRIAVLEESEAIVVRTGHPLTKAPVTTKSLLSFRHVVVELTGTGDQTVDGFIDDRGVWRRVWIEHVLIDVGDRDQASIGGITATVPYSSVVPDIVRGTDLVATLPRRFACSAIRQGGLVMLKLPYKPLQVQIELVWHQRADGDCGSQWIKTILIEAFQDSG